MKHELSQHTRHAWDMNHISIWASFVAQFPTVPHSSPNSGQAAGFTGGIWLFSLWQSEEVVEDTREKLGLHHDLKRRVARSPQTEPTQAWIVESLFDFIRFYSISSIQLAELLMLCVSCSNSSLKFFRPRDKGSHRIGELQIQHFRIEAGGSNWIGNLQHWETAAWVKGLRQL